MDQSKHGAVKEPLKLQPLSLKEKHLLVANTVAAKINELVNEAKVKEFEAKKIRQQIDHLRGLLKPAASKKQQTKTQIAPKTKPAKIVAPEKQQPTVKAKLAVLKAKDAKDAKDAVAAAKSFVEGKSS